MASNNVKHMTHHFSFCVILHQNQTGLVHRMRKLEIRRDIMEAERHLVLWPQHLQSYLDAKA